MSAGNRWATARTREFETHTRQVYNGPDARAPAKKVPRVTASEWHGTKGVSKAVDLDNGPRREDRLGYDIGSGTVVCDDSGEYD